MENSNNKFKEKLIETFVAFDKFCKANDLKYYAAYGTLIGAVRHQGLIPWDDDIDVYMMRDDYNKFCSLKGKVLGHYGIMDINDENYWLLGLAKFVDKDTTLWEFKQQRLIIGVYIDVFPLDECDKNKVPELKRQYDKFSNLVIKAMEVYSFRSFISPLLKFKIRAFWRQLSSILFKKYRLSYYKQKVFECINNHIKYKGDYYVSYDGGYGIGEVVEKSLFSDIVLLPFEGVTIPAPIGYDQYLRGIYGDYMKLPPEGKRVSIHGRYYLNLEKRLSFNEIEKIKNKKLH